MAKIPAKRVGPKDLSPEVLARVQAKMAKAKADMQAGKLGPPVEILDIDPESGISFFWELRQFVKQLKEARVTAGLTLAEVAAKCCIAEETLCRLETGAIRNPTYQTLANYCAAVGRSLCLKAEPDLASARRP